MRLGFLFLFGSVIAACSAGPEVTAQSNAADTSSFTCVAADGTEPAVNFAGAPLPVVCKGVYVDPATTDAQRAQIKTEYEAAVQTVDAFYGDTAFAQNGPPSLVLCTTPDCMTAFSGPTHRSHAVMTPAPTIYVSGLDTLTQGTLAHEMSHVVIGLKREAANAPQNIPTWLDEGTAVLVGNNFACADGQAPGIDDLRRLATTETWNDYTNQPGRIDPTYCQARNEVAAWVGKNGKGGLIGAIDHFFAGQSFAVAYGDLVIPASPPERILDARFSLDEAESTTALDSTGRAHAGVVSAANLWDAGHTGFGLALGSAQNDLRVDGLFDYGLPDMEVTITLWAKPATGSGVLVHSAVDPSGGHGWCMPVLGEDGNGHLVGQIPFAARPDAFLMATAPALPADTWSHVALTWSAADGVRIFVNGDLAGSAAPTSDEQHHRDAPASLMHLFFGDDLNAGCWRAKGMATGHFDGGLDEVRIYSYALTSTEIANDMVR